LEGPIKIFGTDGKWKNKISFTSYPVILSTYCHCPCTSENSQPA